MDGLNVRQRSSFALAYQRRVQFLALEHRIRCLHQQDLWLGLHYRVYPATIFEVAHRTSCTTGNSERWSTASESLRSPFQAQETTLGQPEEGWLFSAESQIHFQGLTGEGRRKSAWELFVNSFRDNCREVAMLSQLNSVPISISIHENKTLRLP